MYPLLFYRRGSYSSNPYQREIIVDGYYAMRKTPDSIVITTSFSTFGNTALEAEAANQDKLNMIKEELKDTGIKDEDIYIIGNTVTPIYKGDTITSFKATTDFNIQVYSFNTLLEYVNNAYANDLNIEEINFTLDDPQTYYYDALQKAVEDGVIKAEDIAKTLGVSIDPTPLMVIEVSNIKDFYEGITIRTPGEIDILKYGFIFVEAQVRETFVILTTPVQHE
ncbi:SIMPL domain-containing protein [Vallitalea okinawensis]|uniref:SIMPL domain-containing protein n=1 Tax=Vallitalea okinawensis TaxID=2078660 RepID=UPI000CFDDA20|nr:SIMPL domain-containing protein [Vallitalea okinawensis]